MKKQNTKIIIFSISSLVLFCASIVCGIFAGVYLQDDSASAYSSLITKECKKQDCGSAIFSSIEFENTEENLNQIGSMKETFDEKLHNQLSLAETNASISISTFQQDSFSLIATDYYDTNYDTMHIYSGTGWDTFRDSDSVIYITSVLERQIRTRVGSDTVLGQKIRITANGITKKLTIGGTYLTDIYPRITDIGCRGDGLINATGETILIHESILKEFKPTKAIAMYSYDSSNNGKKYDELTKAIKEHSFKYQININPLDGSTLAADLEKVSEYFDSSTNLILAIILLILTIILTGGLTATLIILFKVLKPKKLTKKANIIVTSSIGASIISISGLFVLVLRGHTISVKQGVNLPLINYYSLFILMVPILIAIIILLINEWRILLLLFKEKPDNSEFDY